MKRRRRQPRIALERSPLGLVGERAHVPMRTCAGCGGRAAQRELRRMVLAPEGELAWASLGGRGAYLHADEACRDRFVAGKRRVPGLRAMVGREARVRLVENWLALS